MVRNKFSRVLLTIFFLTICSFHFGCGSEEKSSPPSIQAPNEQTPHSGKFRKIVLDTSTAWVEIADNDEARREGLMWRDSLAENHGMLFVFPYAELQSFWMRNTYIPLDLVYIDERWTITDIHQMAPIVDTVFFRSSKPVPYAVELNQGWCEKHGVDVGDKVVLR